MRVPTLETERLIIRQFDLDDLALVFQILDVELSDINLSCENAMALSERERWLRWTITNYDELEKLHQPP